MTRQRVGSHGPYTGVGGGIFHLGDFPPHPLVDSLSCGGTVQGAIVVRKLLRCASSKVVGSVPNAIATWASVKMGQM